MKPAHMLLTMMIVVMMVQATNAQCYCKKGRCKKTNFWEVETGAGLLPTFLKDRTHTIMPPVLLGANYRIKANMSLGIQTGASVSEALRKRQGNTAPSMHRNHYTMVGFRAAAHTTNLYRWEVYGGMMAGYGTSRITVHELEKARTTQPIREYHTGKGYLSAFLGGRFALSKNLRVFSELGMGISLLSCGFTWKIQ